LPSCRAIEGVKARVGESGRRTWSTLARKGGIGNRARERESERERERCKGAWDGQQGEKERERNREREREGEGEGEGYARCGTHGGQGGRIHDNGERHGGRTGSSFSF